MNMRYTPSILAVFLMVGITGLFSQVTAKVHAQLMGIPTSKAIGRTQRSLPSNAVGIRTRCTARKRH